MTEEMGGTFVAPVPMVRLVLGSSLHQIARIMRVFQGVESTPNRESVIRLIGAFLMEQDEKWAVGKKYLDMVEYLE
jgi:hypothetical protein